MKFKFMLSEYGDMSCLPIKILTFEGYLMRRKEEEGGRVDTICVNPAFVNSMLTKALKSVNILFKYILQTYFKPPKSII